MIKVYVSPDRVGQDVWEGEQLLRGEIERGEVTVTIVTARKIAQALGMSLSELFGKLERGENARGVG